MDYQKNETAEQTIRKYIDGMSDQQVAEMLSKIIREQPDKAMDLTAAPEVKINLIYIAREMLCMGVLLGLSG